ncbi:MAG: mandelate racemase/muconate lactonizing enzyme family protein, partial [Planctomycetota bacterium]
NLRAIRKEAGRGVTLQGDANRGYKDFGELAGLLGQFEKAGLNVFEDPLEGTLDDYRRLRGKSAVRIMIDADARSVRAVRDVVVAASCDIINQHPCQQGGMGRALMVSHAAELMGVPTMVGGTGFLGVGTAAYHHLAAVIGLSFPCGELGGIVDHGFEDDIIREGYPVRDGEAELPDVPGIGVEIDEQSLSKLATEERRVR